MRRLASVLSCLILAACGGQTANTGVDVIMQTTAGRIDIVVYTERAPISGANFLAYVDGGHYDGAWFYRSVHPGNDNNPHVITVIQGGILPIGADAAVDPPFSPIAHEPTGTTGLRHDDGALSMARDAPGSAQSEFFISIGDNPVLDQGGPRNDDKQGFAVFGQVTDGMDVVRAINAMPAGADTDDDYFVGQVLSEPVRILTVRRAK